MHRDHLRDMNQLRDSCYDEYDRCAEDYARVKASLEAQIVGLTEEARLSKISHAEEMDNMISQRDEAGSRYQELLDKEENWGEAILKVTKDRDEFKQEVQRLNAEVEKLRSQLLESTVEKNSSQKLVEMTERRMNKIHAEEVGRLVGERDLFEKSYNTAEKRRKRLFALFSKLRETHESYRAVLLRNNLLSPSTSPTQGWIHGKTPGSVRKSPSATATPVSSKAKNVRRQSSAGFTPMSARNKIRLAELKTAERL